MYLFIDLLILSTSLLCLNLYVVNFLVYLSYYCVKIHNLHNTVLQLSHTNLALRFQRELSDTVQFLPNHHTQV